MSTEELVRLLIGSQAGLLAMFVWHLFKCRDTRIDIAVIREQLANISKRITRDER